MTVALKMQKFNFNLNLLENAQHLQEQKKDPGSVHIMTDPDPAGPKSNGSDAPGSGTLILPWS